MKKEILLSLGGGLFSGIAFALLGMLIKQSINVPDYLVPIVSFIAGFAIVSIFSMYFISRRNPENHYTMYDRLTGLPGPQLMYDLIETSIDITTRSGKNVAVIIIDIGRTDPVLRDVAQKIRRVVRRIDHIVRLQGGKIAVIASIDSPESTLERIIKRIQSSFIPENNVQYLPARIGSAVHPEDGYGSDELIRNAINRITQVNFSSPMADLLKSKRVGILEEGESGSGAGESVPI